MAEIGFDRVSRHQPPPRKLNFSTVSIASSTMNPNRLRPSNLRRWSSRIQRYAYRREYTCSRVLSIPSTRYKHTSSAPIPNSSHLNTRCMGTAAHDRRTAMIREQFDADLERVVIPEVLGFFHESVGRRFQENMEWEMRFRSFNTFATTSDEDYTVFPPHSLKDIVRETADSPDTTLGIDQAPDVEDKPSDSLQDDFDDILNDSPSPSNQSKLRSGFQTLSGAAEDVEVINVSEGIAMQNKFIMGQGVTKALVLLRSISETNWMEFDNPESEFGQEQEEDKPLDTGQANGDLGYKTQTTDSIPLSPPDEEISEQVEVDDLMPNEVNGVSVELLTDLIEDVHRDNIKMTTLEFNAFLARLAVSPELLPSEILDAMMATYLIMLRGDKSGAPDGTTFEILLLSFTRRFSAYPTAVDIIHQIRERKAWNHKTLEAAATVCEQLADHDLAFKLLDDVERTNMPGKRFFGSLINLAKADDYRHNALRVLRTALHDPQHSEDFGLDKLFVNATHWRSRNKHGKTIDNSDFLHNILRILESNTTIWAPGFSVWREMICMGVQDARNNPSRYLLIDRAFAGLERYVPRYYPDYTLLKYGLEASQALKKPTLAASVILHAVNNAPAQTTDISPVPGKDIQKAAEICVQWDDATSCSKILAAAESLKLPTTIMKSIYYLCVLSYARRGDSEQTEKILFDIQQRGMVLEDKFYGALMLCYAMSKQIEQAQYLMRSIESGDMGVEVGPAIYDGFVLACVRCEFWDEALEVFRRMKTAGIHPPSPSSCHGILLSGHRQGRSRAESKELLDDLVEAGAQFNQDITLLSTKLLLPELCGESKTVSSARSHLRSTLPIDDEEARAAAMNLISSFRIAEMEEQRKSPSTSLTDPGSKNWTTVMNDILHLVETKNSNGTPNDTNDCGSASI